MCCHSSNFEVWWVVWRGSCRESLQRIAGWGGMLEARGCAVQQRCNFAGIFYVTPCPSMRPRANRGNEGSVFYSVLCTSTDNSVPVLEMQSRLGELVRACVMLAECKPGKAEKTQVRLPLGIPAPQWHPTLAAGIDGRPLLLANGIPADLPRRKILATSQSDRKAQRIRRMARLGKVLGTSPHANVTTTRREHGSRALPGAATRSQALPVAHRRAPVARSQAAEK